MKKMLIAALGIAVALWAAPMAAQHGGGGHGGGGSHGGGSHGGGSHGGGSHGGGFHGGGSHGGGFHGGGGRGGFHGGYHGGWWGPRYGYGWGWGWTGWYYPYYPYYWGGYYGYPGYGYNGGWPGYAFAVVDTDVSPDEARVYLDGRYIGTADDFDGFPDYLYLGRGHYRIEFRLDGYETRVVEFDARQGAKHDIDFKLTKIPGAKQYGSYETPEPEGGIQRFFVKKSDGSDVVAGESAPTEGRYTEGPEGQPPPSGAVEQAPPEGGTSSETWRNRQGAAAAPGNHSTRLVIRVVPMDAAVYVDDRFVGTAEEMAAEPRGLRVSPGHHVVTVSRPGYKDRTVEVDVGSGQSEPVEIELQR